MHPAVAPVFTARFFVTTYEPDFVIAVPHALIGVAARAWNAPISRNVAQIVNVARRIWLFLSAHGVRSLSKAQPLPMVIRLLVRLPSTVLSRAPEAHGKAMPRSLLLEIPLVTRLPGPSDMPDAELASVVTPSISAPDSAFIPK